MKMNSGEKGENLETSVDLVAEIASIDSGSEKSEPGTKNTGPTENLDLNFSGCPFIETYIENNPGASLVKRIKSNFFIFEKKQERNLVFCKIIEGKIKDFQERAEAESLGPWPILPVDHFELLSIMETLKSFQRTEYYINSLETGSMEKIRDIPQDSAFYNYMKNHHQRKK